MLRGFVKVFSVSAVRRIIKLAIVVAAAYTVKHIVDNLFGNGSGVSTSAVKSIQTIPSAYPHAYEASVSEAEKDDLYNTLSLDDRHIRVLVVHPGAASDPVTFHLTTIKLSEPYEALSYHWEHLPGKEEIILVDGNRPQGKTWSVTKNLAAALRALRQESPDDSRAVWVDALCINQKDTKERDVEVLRMRHIYSIADSVILWLGPASQESESVIDFFNSYANDLRSAAQSHPEMWIAFGHHLLERSVWTRLWVVQELVMASKAVIQCGPSKMSWPCFYNVAQTGRDYLLKSNPLSSVYNVTRSLGSNIHVLAAIKTQIEHGGEVGLITLLSSMVHYESSDERDRIYALLGLSKERNNPALRPDYGLDYRKVWTTAVKALVSESKKLDMICLGHGRQRDSLLPSWVPDFKFNYGLQATWLPMNYMTKYPFNASNGRDFIANQLDSVSSLTVRGFILDEVAEMGQAIDYHKAGDGGDADKGVAHLNEIMNEAADMAFGDLRSEQNAKYPYTDETNYQACSRTLVCDLHWDENRCEGEQGCFQHTEVVPHDFRPDVWEERRATMWHKQNFIWKIMYQNHRRFMLSRRGYIGMVPEESKHGDKIVVVYGASVPMILRATSASDQWRVIGASYIHGAMDGQAMRWGSTSETKFSLI